MSNPTTRLRRGDLRCESCGRIWKSDTAWQAHRIGPTNARICLDPLTLGLRLGEDGAWHRSGARSKAAA